jgi:hypothetical protein
VRDKKIVEFGSLLEESTSSEAGVGGSDRSPGHIGKAFSYEFKSFLTAREKRLWSRLILPKELKVIFRGL